MKETLTNLVGNLLIKTGTELKAGNSAITEDEAVDIMEALTHIKIGREEVCNELNVNNTKFYDLVNLGKIPKGRKQRSFKELCWYRDEIRNAIKKIHNKD